jgi:hypothetical protein
MKRVVYITLLIILSIPFQHCREEQEEIIQDSLALTAAITHVTEYGGHDGSIDLTVSVGIPPYAFLWSGSQQTEDIDSLTAGTD